MTYDSSSYGQIYAYKCYNHKSGLSPNSIGAFAEKSDGGILVGTHGAGMVEFDGYHFFDLADSELQYNHYVTGIAFWKKNVLYSTKYDGVFLLDKDKKIQQIISEDQFGYILDIKIIDDVLIAVGDQQLFEYNLKTKSSKTLTQFTKTEGNLQIFDCINTSHGYIFLTNRGSYIYTYEKKFVTLNNFFKTSSSLLENKNFGYEKNGLLYLYDKSFTSGIIVELNTHNFVYKEKTIKNPYDFQDNPIVSCTFNKVKNCFTLINRNGDLFELTQSGLKKIPNNGDRTILTAHKIMADVNGDYWLATKASGLVKVSIAPFTKLNYHNHFKYNRIFYVYKTKKDKVITSNFEDKTYISNLYSGSVTNYSFQIFSETTIDNNLYFGTSDGIYQYIESTNQFVKQQIQGFPSDKNIQFLVYQAPYIWLNVQKEGLYKLDKNFKVIQHFKPNKENPAVIYTGQFSDNGRYFYLGTPVGLKKLDTQTNQMTSIDNHGLGLYCGVSVKDIFGTSWFTLEKGMIGISKQGEMFTLSDRSIFPSTLFFTLNSDNYGNLIIGTNKGINVIQINENGKVINRRNYQSGSGFEGYETHMRASYQGNGYALVASVEGLYFLDFEELQHLPPPNQPVIQLSSKISNSHSTIYNYQFTTKNPKTKTLFYSYRILNYQNDWSPVSESNTISVADLASGTYTIEVKATYDGSIYSSVAKLPITISSPVFRGNLFVIFLILIVVALNTYFYIKTKTSSTNQLYYSEEFFIAQHSAPYLLLFGTFCNFAVNEIAPFILNDFQINHLLVFITSIALLILFFNAMNHRNKGNVDGVKMYLTIGFFVLMAFNIYSLYESSLHPFYGFSILLIGSVSPFIFEKTISISLYTICFISTTTIVILISEDFYYDRFLMLLPMMISGLLSILINYIRHDSLHQLAFVSSIVNKGSVIAFATNKDAKLKYVSKNIVNYFDISDQKLIGSSISFLNDFIPEGMNSKQHDIQSKFLTESHFTTIIQNRNNGLTWFEWTCKDFEPDTRLIIGQDVTEKINLQSTYEILVENAEDLIYQMDTDGNFQFLNNRFNDYLSIEKNSLIGKNVSTLFPDEYKEFLTKKYQAQLSKKEKVTYFEFPMLDKDNNLQWFGQYVTLLFAAGDQEEAIGYLAVGRNITERIKKDSIIFSQSADIKASFNYAKRIQMNLLPSNEKMGSYFQESFVIFKPKDIVSGDFYWCNQVDDYLFIAVGDGTGHGVPGAFMSILGINLLNSIILEKQIYEPGRILDELDKRLKFMLNGGSQEETIRDGIEITICVINNKLNTLEYACAGSKIIIHDGHSFSIRKGDSKHIGESHDDFQGYITHYNNIEPDTTLYLFTDGFQDQFGGLQNKKFSIRRLLELFIQNISLPLSNQQLIIEEEFNSWKEQNEQTDDVTIIGLRKTKNHQDDQN